jgi:hypothetical protein
MHSLDSHPLGVKCNFIPWIKGNGERNSRSGTRGVAQPIECLPSKCERKGGRKEGRKEGREGGREGGREIVHLHRFLWLIMHTLYCLRASEQWNYEKM